MSVFIAIEGVDGAGKSTQLQLLFQYLNERGVEYVFTREPGGTPLAEEIRNLVLSPEYQDVSVVTEAFLFAAGRADHVQRVIRPALEAKKVVISDRYVDASIVYQGYAGGLPVEFVTQINDMATGSLKPHRTIVLDLPWTLAKERMGPDRDRIEQKAQWFHEQVREGYRELAEAEPRRIKLVDASGTPEQVHAQVRRLVDEILPRR